MVPYVNEKWEVIAWKKQTEKSEKRLLFWEPVRHINRLFCDFLWIFPIFISLAFEILLNVHIRRATEEKCFLSPYIYFILSISFLICLKVIQRLNNFCNINSLCCMFNYLFHWFIRKWTFI